MATTELNAQQFADEVLSDAKPDFVYLSNKAKTILWQNTTEPMKPHSEEWPNVVTLTNLLFRKDIGFAKETPDWPRAGCLYATICIQQCKKMSTKELPEPMFLNGELIIPTYPHEYLGYARRCFNSGFTQAGIYADVEISKDNWKKCQRSYPNPTRLPDLNLCKNLANTINTEGQRLLQNPPITR